MLTIHVAPVADLYNVDQEEVILNRVHDPIRVLSDAVAILTHEFLTSRQTRIVGQRLYTLYYALTALLLGGSPQSLAKQMA